MAQIPRDPRFDLIGSMIRDGYLAITRGCQRTGSDVFETRLLLKKVVCMQGKEAAQIFYDAERFSRKGAAPPHTVRLLQGKGSVPFLDGKEHHARKRMWMSLMNPDSIRSLTSIVEEEWEWALARWELIPKIVLQTEAEELLYRAACRWTGVPLSEDDIQPRAHDFGSMTDGAATPGPTAWAAMVRRKRTEKWARQLIRDVRTRDLDPPTGSGLRVLAEFRGLSGLQLPLKIAANELINLLRPCVAIARYVTFAAHALHRQPECIEKLRVDAHYADLFTQEVRRYYPFFPAVGGRALKDFRWRNYRFKKGTWVLFDIYGTNHDPRIWHHPHAFRPERFGDWDESPFDFVPQGGGDFFKDHRCAGEWATIAILKAMSRFLANEMRFQVPDQDLSIPMNRMPSLPRSGMILESIASNQRKKVLLANASADASPTRRAS